MILFVNGQAAHNPVKSRGDFPFYLDTAGFLSSVGNTLQEFYCQFLLDRLAFRENNGWLVDTLDVSLVLIDSTGANVYNDKWVTPIAAPSDQELSGRFLPEQFDLLLAPGAYTAKMEITDRGATIGGVAELPFIAPVFGDRLALSDIQFASDVQRDTSENRFCKNGFKILPNPSRTFGQSLSMLIFYYEIYHSQVPGNLSIFYAIHDISGQAVREFPVKTKRKYGTIGADMGALSVAALSDTLYTLWITVTDSTTMETEKKFCFFRNVPYRAVHYESNIEKMVENFSVQDLEMHIRQVRYLMTPEENEVISALDETGKRRAMIRFWEMRDPDIGTPVNEVYQQYMARVHLANKQFSRGYEPGWLTDRGRIFIKYGPPNQVEKHPLSVNTKPYEMWDYYIEGGLRFIFLDDEGFNQYRLIYTNDRTEISDPNWREYIKDGEMP